MNLIGKYAIGRKGNFYAFTYEGSISIVVDQWSTDEIIIKLLYTPNREDASNEGWAFPIKAKYFDFTNTIP